MAQRNKDLSKTDSTSLPTCPPACPQLRTLEPLAPEDQWLRTDLARKLVWSNFMTNMFLVILKTQNSGSLRFFHNVRKQRCAVCGIVPVQSYCPSTGFHTAHHVSPAALLVGRRGGLQGELRGGKGTAYKGQVQQTPLRFSFISTVLSHMASSVDFNNN